MSTNFAMRGHYICPRGNRKWFRLWITDFELRFGSITARKQIVRIDVPGMTNPNMLIPANADTIQHRVISINGGMPFLRVDKTAAIVEELCLTILSF